MVKERQLCALAAASLRTGQRVTHSFGQCLVLRIAWRSEGGRSSDVFVPGLTISLPRDQHVDSRSPALTFGSGFEIQPFPEVCRIAREIVRGSSISTQIFYSTAMQHRTLSAHIIQTAVCGRESWICERETQGSPARQPAAPQHVQMRLKRNFIGEPRSQRAEKTQKTQRHP